MKPAPFSYCRTRSVPETVARLAELGDGAKILAGGQSLVPMMNFRLARPAALVDITRIPGLDYLRAAPDGLHVGALTRHRTIELCRDPAVLDGWAVLPAAARWIGHYPIRARGTLGGSIAHADPAAEWCLLAVLLGADITLTGPGGARTVPAAGFFEGFYTTAAQPDEMITEVRFPRAAGRAVLTEFAPRQGDFAVIAVAVAVDVDGDADGGRCRSVRVAVGGAGPRPAPIDTASLADQPAAAGTWRAAGQLAAAQIDPPTDGHGSAAYRRKLAATLTERALAQAGRR